jgi:beta-N-acetylhexosaminidase
MSPLPSGLKVRKIISALLLAILVICSAPGSLASASNQTQGNDPLLQANKMLAQMSPEEKVGQLFLVTFSGSSVNQNSDIFNLIVNYHIGGVVLRADRDNFVAAPDTVASAYRLVSQLQSVEWTSSSSSAVQPGDGTPSPAPTSAAPSQHYVPLFVGIFQGGDGYPNDQILSGLTPVPDLMALGATWDPGLSRQVGSVAGEELWAIGFNLFFGPALDVSESPESTLANGLGAGVFSGDPFWVGLLGSAFIDGLHAGSAGKLVVIADHFPGRGSSDRPSGEEAATVRKSLEQLQQIELAPFVTVTGNATTPGSTADGLLVSHIRYQGFQGNIRTTTRPVSFDPQALNQILSLPSFSTWHDRGGLVVSDDLGSQTVRKFYDPGGLGFSARLVARDAFLAGNDLLYLGNITSSDEPDTANTVIQIAEFFAQKYREDPAFQSRVDSAVARILAVKYRIYGSFDPTTVTPSLDGLAMIGFSQAITFEVARRSATLVSPDMADFEAVIPNPPGVRDHLVFLTDNRTSRQCSNCPEQPGLAVDALQNAILRLYGPRAGGQVLNGRLISYSISSLAGILEGGGGNLDLEAYLRQADWVVISMLDAAPGQSQTTLLRRFLSERQDLLRDKRIVVFAFNAPYYLDATDITKITAYYCLYSKSDPFIEVAARLLFRELSPLGSLPVSVPGIGYDLLSATAPDPNQVIQLYIENPAATTPTGTLTPEPTVAPVYRIGDTLSVRTGVILDHNGHMVPDGTGVIFYMGLNGESSLLQQIESATINGMAGTILTISQVGKLEIRAESEPAIHSVVLQLDVTEAGGSITVMTPNVSEIPSSTPTKNPSSQPRRESPMALGYPGLGGWFLSIVILMCLGSLAGWLGRRFASMSWAIRLALGTFTAGLAAYTYLAVRLPGSAAFLQNNGWPGMATVVILGALAGFGVAFGWYRRVEKISKP